MTVTLDWFGCTTYRLNIDGLVVFLDTFMDRLSSAPDNGATSADIKEADFALIGHSHMDHIAGADVIAKNTGAKVIGSFETARVLRRAGVPKEQLLPSAGGELHQLNDDVTVRVFPSLHSCIWSTAAPSGVLLEGDIGVSYGERAARLTSQRDEGPSLPAALAAEQKELDARRIGSGNDGGALDYLIDTPDGTIFFQNSMGFWSGILAGIRADVAIMGCAGRGNIDGEPIQGSVEEYVAIVANTVAPKQLVLGHHDNWAGDPDAPDLMNIEPIREELERSVPFAEIIEPGYQDGRELLPASE
ncbi:MAG: MBL fold metallo-hydrolase [Dehalococcoidia bacterium]|jgi:L-ascorbate metabolism protein UlaG (beta-lactamase superfamily)|nr:MBL fold metallo-hydrolase [Dehalococcoidia bacterium]